MMDDLKILISSDRPEWNSPPALKLLYDFTYGKPGYVRFHMTFNPKDRLSSVLREFIQDADVCERIVNVFEDDETENYYVEYKVDRVDDLIFIYTSVYLHDNWKSWSCMGSRIYHVPVSEYIWRAVGRYDLIHSYPKFDGDYLEVLAEWFRREGLPWDGKNVPFCTTYCQWDWRGFVGVLKRIVEPRLPVIDGEPVLLCTKKQLEEYFPEAVHKYDEMVRLLSMDGKLGTRWKNENLLYASVSKMYADALYQNSPDWLKRQSFDIYIPSRRVAIEYQGKQHYEPIELFGGQVAFEERQWHDRLKKQRCEENGVCLIEWKYTREINKTNLVDLYLMIENRVPGLLE